MILITCQYFDDLQSANYNGGWSQQIYNVDEAKSIALAESRTYASAATTMALTRVYVNGVRVAQYLNGSPA